MNNPVEKARELRRNLGYEAALALCARTFEGAQRALLNRQAENVERVKLGREPLEAVPPSLPLYWRNAFGYLKNRK